MTKIRRMEKTDVDEVVRLEALSYGEHHWSKESFYNELSPWYNGFIF